MLHIQDSYAGSFIINFFTIMVCHGKVVSVTGNSGFSEWTIFGMLSVVFGGKEKMGGYWEWEKGNSRDKACKLLKRNTLNEKKGPKSIHKRLYSWENLLTICNHWIDLDLKPRNIFVQLRLFLLYLVSSQIILDGAHEGLLSVTEAVWILQRISGLSTGILD